jgi:hypothetical protein
MSAVVCIGLALVASLIAFLAGDSPVGRGKAERFARRHSLEVTAGNGSQVIGYLRAVRRWRLACVTFGVVLTTALGLTEQRIEVNFTAILGGLFAGILLAEVRMAKLTSPRRSASLARRRLHDYLFPAARWAMTGSLTVATGLALLRLKDAPQDWSGPALPLVVAVAVWLTIRRVLHRAQPLAEPDRTAADNAIRRQSLQTLAASATALAGYSLLGHAGAAVVLVAVGLAGVPWIAWHLATYSWKTA